MTGITKDEVIRMAGEVGMNNLSLIDIGYLERFANVVLERAVKAKLRELLQPTGSEQK